MKEMGWSYEDLMNTPYTRYLGVSRLITLEQKEEQKQSQREEKKAQRST